MEEFDETEFYLWRSLQKAAALRDFEAVQYWIAQVVIHRARVRAAQEEDTIQA